MTLQERITQLELELQQAQAQLNQWNEIRLRTEGALIILRNMSMEQVKEAEVPQETASEM